MDNLPPEAADTKKSATFSDQKQMRRTAENMADAESHSKGSALRCVRFPLEWVEPALRDGGGPACIDSLLRSCPNMREPLVKARGRMLGFIGGAGDISIGLGYSLSGVRVTVSRGGEFKETFEANESSRSDERSSTSWLGWTWCLWECTGAALRYCVGSVKKGMLDESRRFLFGYSKSVRLSRKDMAGEGGGQEINENEPS